MVAARIDLSLLNGVGRSDIMAHFVLFPAADRSGKARDFMIFADAGIRLPTSVGSGPGDAQAGAAGRPSGSAGSRGRAGRWSWVRS